MFDFDTVVKFVIGWKFLKSGAGRPGFLGSGDTKLVFHIDGNRPTANDRFAMLLIILENSELHALRTVVGNKFSGDVLSWPVLI